MNEGIEEGISRRGVIKWLMAASALVAISPSLLAPVEALAGPVAAALPPVELGDLWMRHGEQSWEFVGKTIAASIRTVVEYDDYWLFDRAMAMHGRLRRYTGDFTIAADTKAHRYIDQLMLAGDQTEVMLGGNAYAVCCSGHVMMMTFRTGPAGLFHQHIEMNLTDTVMMVPA